MKPAGQDPHWFKIELHYWTGWKPKVHMSRNVVCATSKAPDQPVHTHSLIRAFVGRLNIL